MSKIQPAPVKRRSLVTIDGVQMTRIKAIEKYKGPLAKSVLFARLKKEPVCTSARLLRRSKIEGPIMVTIDGQEMSMTDALKKFASASIHQSALRSRLWRNRVCTSDFLRGKSRGRVVDDAGAWTLNGQTVTPEQAFKWLARLSLGGKIRVYKDGTDIRTRPDDGSDPDGYEAIIVAANAETIRDMLT